MRQRGILLLLFLTVIAASAQDSVFARRMIRELTSGKCFGRGYVKSGIEQAAKILISEMKNTGCSPLFGQDFRQPFTMNVNTFPGQLSLKFNGKKLTPGIDYLIEPASTGMKAKTHMIRKDSTSFLSSDEKIPLVLTTEKKLTYSVATNTLPVCIIEMLKENVTENMNIEVHVKNKFIKDFTCHNLAGFVDGTTKSDSLIVFTAHYDHLGGMGNKTYFPGANDNASGVSMILDLMRYYKQHPPRHKTVFIFFAGEEAGLLGSEYFTKHAPFDLRKIRFLINLDLLGTGDDGIMVVNGHIHTKEFEVLNNINITKGLVKEVRRRGKARNSDHYWFTEFGVPAFFIYTLGGTAAYHDVRDVEKLLPLTDYCDVFRLVTEFIAGF